MHANSTDELLQLVSFWISFVIFSVIAFSITDPRGTAFALVLGLGWMFCSDLWQHKFCLRKLYKKLLSKAPKLQRVFLFLWPIVCFSTILLLEPVVESCFAGWLSAGSVWRIESLPRPSWQPLWGGKILLGFVVLAAAVFWKSWLIDLSVDSADARLSD